MNDKPLWSSWEAFAYKSIGDWEQLREEPGRAGKGSRCDRFGGLVNLALAR
jgi:hypothetical protein